MIVRVESVMASDPKVSVMVVTYNQAHLIEGTLDSILAQNYPNIEIVVADDASTDNSQLVLRAYADRYPARIVLILNARNLGITGNCNVALAACTGELICLFAGDDVMLPGKLRAQVGAFVDPAVTLCYHSVDIFDSVSGKTLAITFANPKESVKDVAGITLSGGLAGACSVMVRRSACPITGFDCRLPTVSDWLFLLEVALKGKIVKVDGCYARYRKHAHGASNRTFELLEETLYAFDLACQKHPEHPELVALCRRGKARYLAGEAFRQLGKDIRIAQGLATRATMLDPGALKYRVLLGLSYIPMVQMAGPLLNRAKYSIKRYLSSIA